MLRLDFLVDGFNVYHSLRQAEIELRQRSLTTSTRWLDLNSLLRAHLHVARASVGRVELQRIHYFTALANHRLSRSPTCVADHGTYLDALRSVGVEVVLGRFKKAGRARPCSACGAAQPQRHEEKETDVAIAVRILELLVEDATDVVIVVSGDTDILPGIRAARRLFPNKAVGCLFPFGRKNLEMLQACDFGAQMSSQEYVNHQFPMQVTLRNGRVVAKPIDW